MMPAANVRVKALMVHSSCPRSAPNSRWIAGRAVITTSASSVTMMKAIEVSASVQPREERFISTPPVLDAAVSGATI